MKNTVVYRYSSYIAFSLFLTMVTNLVIAQQVRPLKLTAPQSDSTTVHKSVVYFKGLADPTAALFVDGTETKIYSTGVFAAELALQEGRNESTLTYITREDTLYRSFVFNYEIPKPPPATSGFAIESVSILPAGELWLSPGDPLQVEMKATPGMKATFFGGISLIEVDSIETGVAGIYRGEYFLRDTDSIQAQHIKFELTDTVSKQTLKAQSHEKVSVLNQSHALTGLTAGDNIALSFGLGEDRLGGAKMGYLDRDVKVEITGKMGGMYRIRLSEQTQAYIPVDNVVLQKGIHFRPYSLVSSWAVTTDTQYDYIRLGLGERLPYTSVMKPQENLIVVDIHGAVSNSNWITQKSGLIGVKNAWYEQVSKDVFRVFIEMKDSNLWGYGIGYEGKQLVVRVKPQPPVLALNRLVIGVDAGHGGTNRGAVGMTGVQEKDLNLKMALKLQRALQREGTRVMMTRETDRSVNNAYRVQWAKEKDPDLMISIHCNAAANPMVRGASTYYRHQAFRGPSQYIYDEMLKLGLDDFGNVGGFNFMLNSPTEFPSVLVEVAFMSNPADEELLLDPDFHDGLVNSIVSGLKNYLKAVESGLKI